jgi:Na+-transporting NADH:ubiquinone oxidoreductase subunit NqrB
VKAQLGPGRLLIAVYGVFALSATARASFQLITKFEEAPLAYSLSAISALVYVVATLALAKGERWRTLAYVTVGFELVGVLAVGLLSLLVPELFAHPSVWSLFGAGYAFIPLGLPILGLIWLRRQDARN